MAFEVTNKSTVHGAGTPHGFNTPHKFPASGFIATDTLLRLSKSLYPTGRAWHIGEKTDFEELHKAINLSYSRLVIDGRNTINSTLPDNPIFDEDDALLWEFRLGLITNEELPLEDRKQSILRKLAYPNNIEARQHPNYIELQLQLAGFDVKVYENLKPFQTPDDIIATFIQNTQHGGTTQHADSIQHGSGSFKTVANLLDPNESFNIGGDENLWATFFISGDTIDTMANIPENREIEFRELVLKLKPAHTIAFLLINFT